MEHAKNRKLVYPPGPGEKKGLAALWAYRRGRLGFLQGLAETYGDISYFKLGNQPCYFLNHPDLVKEVLVSNNQNFIKGPSLRSAKKLLGEGLVTSEGDFYRRQRRLAQPAFHRTRIESYAAHMTKYAARDRARWRDGETLDISNEMMRLTLSVVGKTLFDADIESDAGDVAEAINGMLKITDSATLTSIARDILKKTPLLKRFDNSKAKFETAKAKLDAIIYRLIDERRQSGEDRGDLLSMLMLARDEDVDGGQMTDEQLRDEVMTLFVTGYETIGSALTWTFSLLAQNPEAEAKLHAEIDQVLEGRLPTIADFQNLRYAEMVVSESMRLYPPAWAVQRTSVGDLDMGGYLVPKDSVIVLSQYVMHRDRRYFPEPLKFDPERWTKPAREARPQYSYFPFGGGPRRCIGESFAWMEAILLVTVLAQKWRMRLVSKQPVKLQPGMSLRPKRGVLMVMHERLTSP